MEVASAGSVIEALRASLDGFAADSALEVALPDERAVSVLGKPLPAAARPLWIEHAARLLREFERLFCGPAVEYAVEDARRGKALVRTRTEDAIWIRSDQATEALAWGIRFPGFEEDLLLRTYVDRFTHATRGAARLFTAKEKYDPAWMPGLVSDPFERLVLDILNEHACIARHASLEEDFLEKTDLRVRIPELNRPRGARVQVTRTVTPGAFERKAAGVKLQGEFVFVSPWSLAERWNREQGFAPAAAEEKARSLMRTFDRALRKASSHPLGPMAAVGTEIRELIRQHVRDEAFRTTGRLRDREERRG